MATKVGIVNNMLKIDDGKRPKFFTASWCSMDFKNNNVVITDQGKEDSVTIPYQDFQDLEETDINTADTIAAYLSDKIG